jgi:hypothetical protein
LGASVIEDQRRSTILIEITFQNKRADLEAYYDYMVRETEQGKRVSRQVFRSWLTWISVYSMLLGSLMWGATGRWQLGLGVTLFIFLAGGTLKFLISGFKPIYQAGMRVYRSQERSITPRDLQFYQLPRTIMIDDNWLEIRGSESVHRWRWRAVDKIALTPNFVFIYVGSSPTVYIPKRDFASEESFTEFAKRLVELREKNKDQPIGGE